MADNITEDKNKIRNPLDFGNKSDSKSDSGKIKIISETEEKVDNNSDNISSDNASKMELGSNNSNNSSGFNSGNENQKVKFSNKPIVVKGSDNSEPNVSNNSEIPNPIPVQNSPSDNKINNNNPLGPNQTNSIPTDKKLEGQNNNIPSDVANNSNSNNQSPTVNSTGMNNTNTTQQARDLSYIPQPNQKPISNPTQQAMPKKNFNNSMGIEDKEVSQYISNRKLVGGVGDVYAQQEKQPKRGRGWNKKEKKKEKPDKKKDSHMFEAPITNKKVKIGGPNKASWLIFGGLVFLIISISWWYISGGSETVKTLSKDYSTFIPFLNNEEDQPTEPTVPDQPEPNENTEPEMPEVIITVEDNILNDDTILNIDKFVTRSSDGIKKSMSEMELYRISEELNQLSN